jgi:hypothetical protein
MTSNNPMIRMGQWRACLCVAAVLLPHFSAAQTPGFPVVDFQRYFPQFLAVSEEVQTKEFSQGVQYKLLSTWDEQEQLVFLALIRRDSHDRVQRILLSKGPMGGSEARFRNTVNQLADKVGSALEVIDLRGIRTQDEFHARAVSLGWGIEILK